MRFAFTKMHGAGNDFVVIDDRASVLSADDPSVIRQIANRPGGIGCEGVIIVRPAQRLDFAMRFFNPDGSEAELCGNGARCVSAFAFLQGIVAKSEMKFETLAGDISARILSPELVSVSMPAPRDLRENFVNSGVPHAIVPVQDLNQVDVSKSGREIRYSSNFAPAGTNVDFVRYEAPNRAFIRTYERGVEAETFACGTGAVATAVIGVAQYGLSFPVEVITTRGVSLTIDGAYSGTSWKNVTLTGPVKVVFTGSMEI